MLWNAVSTDGITIAQRSTSPSSCSNKRNTKEYKSFRCAKEFTINHRDFGFTATNQETPHHQPISMPTVLSSHLSVSRERGYRHGNHIVPYYVAVCRLAGLVRSRLLLFIITCAVDYRDSRALPKSTVDKGKTDSSRTRDPLCVPGPSQSQLQPKATQGR